MNLFRVIKFKRKGGQGGCLMRVFLVHIFNSQDESHILKTKFLKSKHILLLFIGQRRFELVV